MNKIATKQNLGTKLALDIIEDGKKLRSLAALIAKYDLKFPFTAYNHKYKENILVTGIIPNGGTHSRTCCFDMRANAFGAPVASSSPCTACFSGVSNHAGWNLSFENWTLAGDK